MILRYCAIIMCKNLSILLSVFLLAGCGVSASAIPIYTADGKKGYSINCSGGNRNWGLCYQRAGNICKERGYDVLEVTGEAGTVTSVKSGAAMSTATTTTTHNRIMIVQCQRPELPEESSFQSIL